ncbi:MAG TPA: TenA family protein [Rhodospirillaceae bacterium]|nr:TenA family protein [Rhodospirillaceae bacterium]
MKDNPQTLFARLKAAAPEEWSAFARHDFLRRLGDGRLGEEAFRRYLGQDYLFLVQLSRAYGLAVFKSDNLDDLRQAAAGMAAILDEMGLHLKYCHDWGLTAEEMGQMAETGATTAYTRYVLERGVAGDLLDLHVTLAPCVIGFSEIAVWMKAEYAETLDDNPYRAWVDLYAGADYRRIADAQLAQLDHLLALRGGPGRFPALQEQFGRAVRLMTAFWDAGLALNR